MVDNILKQTEKGVIISIKLVPNSSQEKVLGYTEEYLKVKICAPPVENKANKQLINFLSKLLQVPKTKISFVAGEKSKIKRLLILDVKQEDIFKIISFYDKI